MSNKTQLATNNTQLASLISTLQGKAAGSGGGTTLDTCTVVLAGSESNYRPTQYTYMTMNDSGGMECIAVSNNSSTSVTLENVISNSIITVLFNSTTGNFSTITGLSTLAEYYASSGWRVYSLKITAAAGETATLMNQASSYEF